MGNSCLKITFLSLSILLNNGFAMEKETTFSTLPPEIICKILENFHSNDPKDFLRLSAASKTMRNNLQSMPLHLHLWDYREKITNDSLKHLIEVFPNIQFLNLGFCKKITPEGLQALAKLSQLRVLELYSTNSNDVVLRALSNLEQLTTLNFDSCDDVTDEGLQHIKNFKNLRLLNLKHCSKTTIGVVKDLRSQISNLDIDWGVDDL